ncbi:MAG: A24 family peptidase [Pseudomonadota bacterium]|nr:A24 family peptidase [Pseudomonadota bacterium]
MLLSLAPYLYPAALAIMVIGLAALFWIDLKTGYLPDILVFPLAVLGLLMAVVGPIGPLTLTDCLAGAALGAGLMALFRTVATRILHREAMGLGDVKFMGMAGLWVGWQGLNAILVGGVVMSFLIGLFRHLVMHRSLKGFGRGVEIPLGPGLCVALLTLVVLNWYGIQIGPGFVPMAPSLSVPEFSVLFKNL